MRPVQLLGLAFLAAVFAGVVTLMTTGVFQERPADQVRDGIELALVFAGITFIVTLVTIALLMLAVDPGKVAHAVDRPVLYPDEDSSASDDAPKTRGSDGSDAEGEKGA